ncbi:tyrosine-type recombinase/integrase [Candidatus Falkowbacteria bacterium]|nr:tyrosine-type recombinase/integrase [Candidatus Falkowbacteria bacterium]
MQPSTLPITQHIKNFLDYIDIEKGLSSKTQENYSRYLKRFTDWLKENKLHDLLPHQLDDNRLWNYRVFLARKTLSRQTKQSLSKKTQNFYLIALRALLSYFAEKDILSLPADKIKLAKQNANHSIHFLPFDQIEKLLASPDVENIIGLRDRAILETLFSSGLRVSELVSLNRENFEKVKDKFLELSIMGKGNKSRAVYFSSRCLVWLAKYLQARKDVDKALFVNYKPGAEKAVSRRITSRSVESIIKKYNKIAGLPLNTTPHTLRHSYATDLLNQGVDLRLVQEFLGHANISTTQIYTHVTNKKLKDVYLRFHSGNKIKNAKTQLKFIKKIKNKK